MDNEEIVERIREAELREPRPERVGRHDVLVDRVALPGGPVTTVYRVEGGRVAVVRATHGSYREDAAALLAVAGSGRDAGGGERGQGATVTPEVIEVPGFGLDRAVIVPGDEFHSDPELQARTVAVVAAHRSEVLAGEAVRPFRFAMSSRGIGVRVDDWGRTPVARADARLLDEWPGGPMRQSAKLHPWSAERLLTRVAPDGPGGVRVAVHDVRGNEPGDGCARDALPDRRSGPGRPAKDGRAGRMCGAAVTAHPADGGELGGVQQRSRGRTATLDEAERMLTVLAREDRSAIDELGELESVAWS